MEGRGEEGWENKQKKNEKGLMLQGGGVIGAERQHLYLQNDWQVRWFLSSVFQIAS